MATKQGGVFIPRLYKSYKATITQATTAAPAEGVVIENSVGDMTLGRTSAGIYTFTSTGAFNTTKTICKITGMGAAGRAFSYAITSADVITVSVFDLATPSAADSGNFYIEFEVPN
jgi:hypothetical protein